MTGRRREAITLLLITAVELIVFLDATVVNIALPAIGTTLQLSESQLAWVSNAYLLTFGGFMLVGGRATDLLGPRRMFVAGLAVFTIASAAAGFAPTATLLIAGRALQGLGAAVLVPAQIALLKSSFSDPAAQRKAFAVWSAMGASGAALGTAIGGLVTQGLGWPAIFLLNLPVGVAGLIVARPLLAADPQEVRGATARLDLPGAVIGTSALLLIGYGLGETGQGTAAWATVAVGAALLAGFLTLENRARHPLMPLRLFRVRAVTGASLVNALVGAAHVPAFVLLSLYFQIAQGYEPIRSGLAVMPVALAGIVFSRTVLPSILKRLGAARVLALGLALQAVALAWYARLPVDADFVRDVLPPSLVFGVGLPAAFVGVTVPAVSAVEAADAGVVAGIVNTTQRIGAGLGVTGLLLIATTWTERSASADPMAAYVDGLRAGFSTAAGLAAVGAALSLVLLTRRSAGGEVPSTPDVAADRTATRSETAE